MSTQQPPGGPGAADVGLGAVDVPHPLRGTAPTGPEQAAHIPTDMVDLLRTRTVRRGDRLVFSFSRDGEERENNRVTYSELDARARKVAAELQQLGAAGECVLVFCQPGIEFIVSYFGCLYAGAVAVPVHPPMRDHLVPRVESILADNHPGFAISTPDVYAKIKPTLDRLPRGSSLRWCIEESASADAEQWAAPQIDPASIAMIQYTSGSTSAPKGVMLSHGNLVHNLETIRQAWGSGFDNDEIGVFWLPPFHDMGLIGGLLETMYVGGYSILMPPTAFIKGPMRWLNAMSRHRATITTAPNFAYDMCAELSTPEQREALDLSHWKAALCGAEPVRTATLDGFAEAFAPSGFRPEAFLPVYGLAEATLLVSGGSDAPTPIIRYLDRPSLRADRVVDDTADDPHAAIMIGCGKPRGGQRVAIVDPETRLLRAPDEVGEIWVSGGSVAQGYWESPELTEEIFGATLADDTSGQRFLRTGDLGFLRDGELFVTGRRKDLIIIRGANFYPNDIELTVQDTNPVLLRGRGAVFSVEPESGGGEQLIIAQEVNHHQVSADEMAEIIQKIRTAVTARYGIRAHTVVLIEGLQLPTTSSGKIQRSACKQKYLDGELPVVARWSLEPAPAEPEVPAEPETPAEPVRESAPAQPTQSDVAGPDAAEISDWLVAELSRQLELPTAEIDPTQPFSFYGLDSVHAVRLTTELEKWLGREFEPTLAYEYPTIEILARYLAGDESAGLTSAAPADEQPPVADDPIAIVGIGCRFPGADGPAAFWQLLTSGTDATCEVPPDRWNADAFYNPDPSVPGTAVTRRGGFLREQIDCFDYQFFGISPRESAQMDPQQRLLLEVAWEALEDAGQVPDRLAGSRTGVFVGISTNDYGFLRMGQPQLVDAYTGTGNALSIAANRLSYVFDFHGPSMAIDTACSSSLVAVDLACRSLRDGECTMALAGGVNVMLSPALSINFSKARVMAPDGRCKTFDADADGYVRGEGAGVVVLKPLSRALADNDPIYAVIRGSATNSDGRTNGLIAPGEPSQEAVLAAAYRRAGLPPGAVQYVEAHGTGTAIGDAIEAKALGAVLADGRPPGSRCLVGSVKTNIGHLEAAAGVAGLIKVALSLRHRMIPASLNFTTPSPHIPFAALPLDVVSAATPWPDNGGRAVAGVSSFGFGGTNAHVVLTEAPQVRGASPIDGTAGAGQARTELLPLSARSPEALAALVDEYEMALFAGTSLTDLCYTAGARRGHHEYRLSVVGDSPAQLFESLA
ncbi:MAG TPA: beta-ketoacyl synthase N-terminal-like domain-containing protein, partial [Mycobacterium sp.]